MRRLSFSKIVAIAVPLALSACATPPNHINDVCAVFDQNDGWFDNWQAAAQRTEQKYGVPVPVLMATVRKESGFKSNARPPRTKLLGFIPWKHISSATGFSQALDGTWAQYQSETGSWAARRTRFADAVDFVGWYHSKTAETLGVARNDTYNLYLAYYLGWNAYKHGNRGDADVQRYAHATEQMAQDYAAQLRQCAPP
ncbi:transglycosylase SLT domain-containing protein [Mesorhizobium sp. M0408]|uniref:transglycosylase SLT domain-containing protein n=1 Tax=Mesorhizobium sp. M0408 TaxID=2956942 RepID=UPI00333A5C6A